MIFVFSPKNGKSAQILQLFAKFLAIFRAKGKKVPKLRSHLLNFGCF